MWHGVPARTVVLSWQSSAIIGALLFFCFRPIAVLCKRSTARYPAWVITAPPGNYQLVGPWGRSALAGNSAAQLRFSQCAALELRGAVAGHKLASTIS